MVDTKATSSLDEIPSGDTIESLRDEARDGGESAVVTFPEGDGERKRLVVSPRGTCVLLNDVSEDVFNSSVEPHEIAAALRE